MEVPKISHFRLIGREKTLNLIPPGTDPANLPYTMSVTKDELIRQLEELARQEMTEEVTQKADELKNEYHGFPNTATE